MKYIIIFFILFSSCVIDPTRGRIITTIDTDATEYNLAVYCDYKDRDMKITLSEPNVYKRTESWHTDVYDYSYSYTHNGSYFTGNIHIVYPNEYECRDIKIE